MSGKTWRTVIWGIVVLLCAGMAHDTIRDIWGSL